jgi:hypothetical protein
LARDGARDTALHGLIDLHHQVVRLHAEVPDDRQRDAVVVAQKAAQDVLRSDVFVLEPRRFLTGHGERFPNAFGEVVPVHRTSEKGSEHENLLSITDPRSSC